MGVTVGEAGGILEGVIETADGLPKNRKGETGKVSEALRSGDHRAIFV